jgi:translation initiation factor IF-3
LHVERRLFSCPAPAGPEHLDRQVCHRRPTPGGPISTELRINDRIRVPEVRLVGPNGETVGIVRIEDALRLAQEADLDLVEVAPTARPPVCKLMDYGKFKYENAQKAREARRNQTNVVIKEMKLRPKIDAHDYETKKGHVVRFLRQGDKVHKKKAEAKAEVKAEKAEKAAEREAERAAEHAERSAAATAGTGPKKPRRRSESLDPDM